MPLSTALIIVFSAKAGLLLGLWIGRRRGRAAGEAALRAELEPRLQDAATKLALAGQSIEHEKQINELQSMELEKANGFLAQQREAHRAEMEKLGGELNSSKSKVIELEAISAKDKEIFEAERRQLDDLKAKFKQEFENLANQIFESKHKAFDASSREGLNAMLLPFKEQLESFRQRVDQVHTENVQGQSTIKNEIGRMQQLNLQMSQDASNLTSALKGDKKMQGNWGEQKLEMLLDRAGLQKGIDYEREQSLKDDEGKNFRPDFVVKLPDGKHIVIDSKVSLVDYVAYCSVESEEERERSLKAHVAAIRSHIKELSKKNYHSLIGVESPDFTLLFIAIEPAFMAALGHAPTLAQEAFESGIALVSATTLMPQMLTVASLWRLQRKNKSTEDLAESARIVHDRLHSFLTKMDKLGGQLNASHKTYEDAMGTLVHGSRSLVNAAERFKVLGVKVANKLPLSSQADLGAGGDYLEEGNGET
jgi:DNA recombination protein RmuC